MTPGGPASSREHASGVIFRQMPITYDLDWHPAPRKQYVIHLDGDAQITASDGEVRIIKAGEIMLVEDVNGKGHRRRTWPADRITSCSWRWTEPPTRD